MTKKYILGFAHFGVLGLAVMMIALIVGVASFPSFKGDTRSRASVLSSTATLAVQDSSDIANEDGSSFSTGGDSSWLGVGQNTSSSYLGLRFQGDGIPKGAQINSAKIEFSPKGTQWISIGVSFLAENSTAPESFSSSNRPSSRSLISASKEYSDDVKWEDGNTYSYDVTNIVQELVNADGRSSIVFIVKGTGDQWGRKFIYSSPSSGKAPKLIVSYTTDTADTTSVATTTASPTVKASPTSTAKATAAPTLHPISTTTPTGNTTQSGGNPPPPPPSSTSGAIFGVVGADTLGTCSAAVHDKYVTTGPDGRLYRTWHPARDPSGCTFGHEHGDDPATSNIYNGKPVPFGYVAAQLNPPMDEPHVGFKCFVHNKGTRNDEGGVMLHDSYYCFHMGTGGATRFTTRFHSLVFYLRTSSGYIMNLQGMADTGSSADSICANPRQGRTVQAFGCLIDSPYEIWANKLFIRNRGNVVASVITSTAVFDPITSMDPADKTRLVYSWSPEAQEKIFRFDDPKEYFRGCDREAYTGPVAWYNRGGSTVYYTDPYGNVVDGGPLRQEVSAINTNANSVIDQFGGLIFAYKGGSDPQSQFKLHKSACVPGLGVKN